MNTTDETNGQPNILLIMADQLTPFMMGCYGNPDVITPNLDALARSSRIYDAAYTANPLCTPARAAMMTGRYTGRLDCYDNASAFSSEIPTLAHYLTHAGYETVLSGKMHFIGPDQLHGFEKRLNTDIYPADFSWLPTYVSAEEHTLQSTQWGNAINYSQKTARPREWNDGLQYDEEVQAKTRDFLYRRKDKRPLFLCVSYHHPHDPFQPPQHYWDLYENQTIRLPDLTDFDEQGKSVLDRWLNTGFHRTDVFDVRGQENLKAVRRAYSALVTYIDDKVGELIRDLKQLGLYDKTIIIFTSDHGDMLGERAMVQKRCFYEWSARIPLLVRLPDSYQKTVAPRIPGSSGLAGSSGLLGSSDSSGSSSTSHAAWKGRCSTPVSLIDLAPTLLEWAGLPLDDGSVAFNDQPSQAALLVSPDRVIADFDGVSLLRGRDDHDAPIFCESHGEGILWPCYMIRRGPFKYTLIHQKDEQLFSVADDPQELHDLAALPQYATLKDELKSLILDRFDPEQVLVHLQTSNSARRVIRSAMRKTGQTWDYTPTVDESHRFVR